MFVKSGTIAGVGSFLKAMNEEIKIVLADPQGSGLYHKVSFHFRSRLVWLAPFHVGTWSDCAFEQVHDGVMYSSTEEEGKRRRHQMDTVRPLFWFHSNHSGPNMSICAGCGRNRVKPPHEKLLLGPAANRRRHPVSPPFPFLIRSPSLPLIFQASLQLTFSHLPRVTDAEAVAMSRFLAKEDGLFLGSSSAVNLVACVRLAQKLGPGKRIVTILWWGFLPHSPYFLPLVQGFKR